MTPELKSALLSMFIQYAVPVLFSALGSLALWGLARLGKKWGEDGKASRLARVGAWAAHLASVVVSDLEATLKPELKAATADGVLTPAEVSRLRDVALARLKAMAGEKGLAELKSGLGIAAPELDKYLLGLLEKSVAQLPSGVSSVAAGVTPAGGVVTAVP